MKQKGFSTTLILIIVAVLAIGGYSIYSGKINFSRKQNELTSSIDSSITNFTQCSHSLGAKVLQDVVQTYPRKCESKDGRIFIEEIGSNWKTYTSINCGFSFKFPENWETYDYGHMPKDEPQDNCGPNLAEERFLKPIGDNGAEISLEITPSNGTSYQLQADSIKNYMWGNKIIVAGPVLGRNGTVVKGNDKGKNSEAVVFIHGNYIYKIQTLGQYVETDTLEQILSTFKFTDQKQSTQTLKPADSQYPAAGICADPPSSDMVIFDIKVQPDGVPQPRCQKALRTQKLEITNHTDKTLEFNLAQYNLAIKPGENKTINNNLGSFLDPGVHHYNLSPYPGPELWVQ